MNRLPLLALCLWLLGCPSAKKLPDLPKVDFSALPLPKGVDGHYVLIQASASRLEIDPTASDAITAVGACTDLVTYCVSGGDSVDTCVAAARGCATETPWNEREACCPGPCKTAYEEARKTAEPIDAFEHAFFLEPKCFPGLAAALEGQP